MSLTNNNVLFMRPFEDCCKRVSRTGYTALPGRLAALSQPTNEGRSVLMAEKDHYAPDLAMIVSSGINGFRQGETVVLAPDHGTFLDPPPEGWTRLPGSNDSDVNPYRRDDRELRIIGVIKPWWESVIGKWSKDGFAAAPGWLLIDREPLTGEILTTDRAKKWNEVGIVGSDCTDQASMIGERVVFTGMPYYTFDSCLPKSYCVVNAGLASKKWLRSLETDAKIYV